MSDLPWIDGATRRSTQELLGLEGRYRTDSIVVASDTAIQAMAATAGLDSLTEAERTVLAAEAFENAVNCDGFSSLLDDHPDLAPLAAPALRSIGSHAAAALAEQALAVLDDAERDDRLAQLDERYLALAVDLAAPLLAYIREHEAEIRLPT